MRLTRAIPVLIGLFLCVGATALGQVGVDSNRGRAIAEAVERAGLGQFWGAVLVAREGEPVLARGFGFAGDDLKKIDADSLFDIGSVAKQFTAAAILRLEMDGKLSASDPVSKFFPAVGVRGQDVTLHHLLTHTSGMDDRVAIQRLDFPDRDEAVRLAMGSVFASRPGERFAYCNAGYVVLAAVVEKASGRPFQEYMREEIFDRAGMKDTAFIDGKGLDPARQTARIVGSWLAPARRTTLFDEPWGWGLRGAGGVATTLNDLIKWDRALAGKGVLSSAAKLKMHTPALSGYGYGWFITATDRGTTKIWHSGSTRGYRCILSRLPDEGCVVAVLTNESGDPARIEGKILSELFPTPRSTTKLFVNSLALNRYQAAQVDGGVRWRAARVEGEGGGAAMVKLELAREAGGAVLVEVTMPAGAARGLAARIGEHVKGEAAEGGSMTVVLGTLPYKTDQDGVILIPEETSWTVMPGYSGVGENGERTVDERPTLVLMDRDRSFWPLIVRMDDKRAAALVRDLAKAAGE